MTPPAQTRQKERRSPEGLRRLPFLSFWARKPALAYMNTVQVLVMVIMPTIRPLTMPAMYGFLVLL